MSEYRLPLPCRPPADAESVIRVEAISDVIFSGVSLRASRAFFPVHIIAFQQSTSAKLRGKFKTFLNREMDLYDKLLVYGQLKGWVDEPPAYRV